jgi:ABC-type antimicrobial peptide transport system permease subunit
VLGTTPDYLLIRDWEIAAGAPFSDDDVRRGAMVCLLGQRPLAELFGEESAVGKQVRVNNVSLKVVGVLAHKGASATGRDMDDIVLAPWTTVKFRLSGERQQTAAAPTASAGNVNSLSQLYPSEQLQLYTQRSAAQLANTPLMTRFTDLDDIWVSVTSAEQIEPVKKQITAILRERHRLADDTPDDFRIRDWTELSQTIAATNRLLANLLLCVALISLVVGGVGIMNIMLVSVTERTREIGIRMAVGARGRDIRAQFLTEAAILCLAGGAAGIALGRSVAWIITAVLGWPTVVSLPAMVGALVVSVGVGLIFGFYPAHKAARLDPIEALRYE